MKLQTSLGAGMIQMMIWLLMACGVAHGDEPAEGTVPAQPRGTIVFSSVGVRYFDIYLRSDAGGESLVAPHPALDFNAAFAPDGERIAFVSRRDGNMELYVVGVDGDGLRRLTNHFALDDHPAWSPDGRRLAFVSTRQAARSPGQAWNAIYVMSDLGTDVRRLSPEGVADYSPCWSPRGDLIACASGSGKSGESDIVVMAPDGKGRRLVVKNGGWPAFILGGDAIAFHRRGDGGEWQVWQVDLDGSNLKRLAANASMPRATADGSKLVFVMREGRRQKIARLDLAAQKLDVLTDGRTDCWNPSIAPDGKRVVYHRVTRGRNAPNVELWGRPPKTQLDMLRVAGAFPAFSPDERKLALAAGNFSHIDVMNADGSERKTIYQGERRSLFGMSWSHSPEWIAFSHGVVFGKSDVQVNLMAVPLESSEPVRITRDATNNGFPCFSPDGKRILFRSGRDGAKNLYTIDRTGADVQRLTKGKWTDTMCDWSPDGGSIVFASDREDNFEIWIMRADGTGLRKLIGGGGRNTHPHFSPDGKWVVFASQRAGYSAEEVSLPSQPQPYGELFIVRVDGTDLRRLTHDGTEEGTPTWGAVTGIVPAKAQGGASSEY